MLAQFTARSFCVSAGSLPGGFSLKIDDFICLYIGGVSLEVLILFIPLNLYSLIL